jgi:DedD protein
MDSSLKQRLLGAVVLIALAIIFVPMFLSGSGPGQQSETVDLAIPPAPDREFQTRVLPVDAGQPVTREPVTTVQAPPAPVAIPQPDSNPPAVATVKSPPAATLPVEDGAKAPTPAPSAPAATASTPGKAADSGFYVHLGVYATAGNAAGLVSDLGKAGYPAFAEASTYQGKPAERVRVGPYDSRAGAEAARLKIARIKPQVPGSVVELASDATTDAPPTALPAGSAGGWAVQLGAFSSADDANKLRDRLRNTGFAAFVDQSTSDGKPIWRVRAGPELARADADQLRSRIKDKLKIDGIVVVAH